MKVIRNTFDPEAHEQALQSFNLRLKALGYNTPDHIAKVVIDPNSIAGVDELFQIQHDEKPNTIVGNILLIVVAIDKTILKVYFQEGDPIDVPVGNPTKKGYRSKYRDFERFAVNEQLALCTKALGEMEKFVHAFKKWDPQNVVPSKPLSSQRRKGDVYGYPSDLFGGDPSSYWNID